MGKSTISMCIFFSSYVKLRGPHELGWAAKSPEA